MTKININIYREKKKDIVNNNNNNYNYIPPWGKQDCSSLDKVVK